MKTELMHKVREHPAGTPVVVLHPIIGPERPGPDGRCREYWMCRMPDGTEEGIPAGALDAHPHLTREQILEQTGADRWDWVAERWAGQDVSEVLADLDTAWPDEDNGTLAQAIVEALA
jgi:hypothetical protein